MVSCDTVIALWAGLVLASLSGPQWEPPAEPSLDALVRRLRSRQRDERVARISARFVGAPYVLGPLGEGRGRDPDPLWRWDAMDCVTFVEQVLALADSDSLVQAEAQLQRIRYAHRIIRYPDRNHLMEPAWLPNNIRKGFVRPITKQVAGRDVRFLWRREQTGQGICDIALPYLPIDKALAHQREIPNATLFFVARRWGHPVPDHVSHVGLLIRKDGKLYARHASALHGRVIDEPFAAFLNEERHSLRRWPVVGLELAEPSAPFVPLRALETARASGDAEFARGEVHVDRGRHPFNPRPTVDPRVGVRHSRQARDDEAGTTAAEGQEAVDR